MLGNVLKDDCSMRVIKEPHSTDALCGLHMWMHTWLAFKIIINDISTTRIIAVFFD